MTDLVKVVKGVPLVSTLDMWGELNVEHDALMKTVRKYENLFQKIRSFGFESRKSGGRPTTFCHLDEEQATFLITLMRNSETVVPFKFKLSREFYRMKNELIRLASQNQNAHWLEIRQAGKEVRNLATDHIKDFTVYAKKQGSTNAEKYYAIFTKMENSALFLLEQTYPNLRNVLNINQLSTVKCADQIVIKALIDGMEQKLDYHDIYKLAKARVESFAEVIGKTLIPQAQLQIEVKL